MYGWMQVLSSYPPTSLRLCFLYFLFSFSNSTTELIFFLNIFYHQRSSSSWIPAPTSTLTLSFLHLTGKLNRMYLHSMSNQMPPKFTCKEVYHLPKVDPEFWRWKMPSNCLLLWFINLALNKNATVLTSIYLLSNITSLACFSLPDLTCLNAIRSDRLTFSLCILT